MLQTGSLPIAFTTLDQSSVSATLGKDSLRQGLIAGIIGLVLVMIYLLVVYRFLGLVADIALLIYAALFYGLIVLVPITMTLPGIAGIILTIGVAADANVVIFERIKEEVRLGRTVRQAISQGYSKGFHTILDANVCTLITAAVLYIAGTGSVKGFAFTLAVGVIVSMFTAVLATRAMLSLLGGFRWFHNAAFMGASGAKVRWRFDVTGRKKLWFTISIIVVLISVGSLAVRGLNLGIDFEGGTRVTTTLEKPQSPDTVKNTITGLNKDFSDAIVQGRGNSVDGKYTRVPDRGQDAHARRGRVDPRRAPEQVRHREPALRLARRLGVVRLRDPEIGDLRRHLLAAPDRRLRVRALRVEVRGPDDRGADTRRGDHDRGLLDHGSGGDVVHRSGGAHRPRLLAVRHDHRVRPRA